MNAGKFQSERGATLVIAVLVLVVLTLLGLAAVVSSNLASDASGNLKAKTASYHMAEACMYTQIRRIQVSGSGTTALTCAPGLANAITSGTCDLGTGFTCTATAPTTTGGTGGSSGVLDGYSLESGSAKIGTIPYQFSVTGTGPRGASSVFTVGINLPSSGGGY
jgi:Tfp pilus assembly protein PilX